MRRLLARLLDRIAEKIAIGIDGVEWDAGDCLTADECRLRGESCGCKDGDQ